MEWLAHTCRSRLVAGLWRRPAKLVAGEIEVLGVSKVNLICRVGRKGAWYLHCLLPPHDDPGGARLGVPHDLHLQVQVQGCRCRGAGVQVQGYRGAGQ